MGLFDKLKGAVNVMTGGAARVSMEYPQGIVSSGEPVPVKISVTSTGAEVKSGGVFVDVRAEESVRLTKRDSSKITEDIALGKTSFEQIFQIAPAFVLAANETKVFEGTFQLPGNVLPTFSGTYVSHNWQLRGRLEALGNDPDTGFQPFRVASKS